MPTIECVPNISEGRRLDVVDALVGAVRHVAGVRVLDYSSDVCHNRSVFTLVGDADSLRDAVLALFDAAVASIDLRSHQGVHPRMGAVDVVPFIPLDGATMDECVDLARSTAAEVAARFQIPVYLYESAATRPERRQLENIRRGEFEGLAAKMRDAAWVPDFGPAVPHPSAGASAIGARMPLIAYNINLATDRLDVARKIAAAVRHSSGGLPFVKALGLPLAERGIVQVSMNLTNYRETPIRAVFDAVKREAERHGVAVLESELIGLAPAAALPPSDANHIQLKGFTPDQLLETRMRRADTGVR